MNKGNVRAGIKCFYEGRVVKIISVPVNRERVYVKFKDTKEYAYVFTEELKPYIKPSRLLAIAEGAIQGLIIDDKEAALKYLREQVELTREECEVFELDIEDDDN
ncbi:MAG: hypothetical protein IJE43_02335 [Alphaproteobacteria bacterium]|nr:hypothetical protein [Alphaproteobacteria bacterium]